MPLKKCVVNFAKDHWYPRGQDRLRSSLIATGFDGHMLFHNDERGLGAPSHQECSYGFKPYALLDAVNRGYTHILWCDASMWAIRNIQPMPSTTMKYTARIR